MITVITDRGSKFVTSLIISLIFKDLEKISIYLTLKCDPLTYNWATKYLKNSS